jgi:hypothetical protein
VGQRECGDERHGPRIPEKRGYGFAARRALYQSDTSSPVANHTPFLARM